MYLLLFSHLFRLVPKGQIEVSTILFVRSKDDTYRKGFVSSKTYTKLVIRVYGELIGLVIVDANDSAAVVPDVVPDPASLTVGRTVIATYDTFMWEAGNIVQIRKLDESGQYIYRVRFISGGDTWVFNINNIRILMTRKPKGVFIRNLWLYHLLARLKYDKEGHNFTFTHLYLYLQLTFQFSIYTVFRV